MEETLVFIDEGFLDKLTKLFGKGIRLKFDKFEFAKRISKKQNLFCKHLFYYTAPPFQGTPPTKKERSMKEGYDKFISSLSKNKNITIREGRCQKIINQEGKIDYKQKGVDTLLTIDLSHLKEDHPQIKKIILVSSDTDFCPAIRDIKERGNIEVILYIYFDKKRGSKFSLSNELIFCCSEYFKLTKQDFNECPLEKKENVT
ncbi:MAG: NYN domain-containing protein [Nanoarchaeota archaeon]|nr:NYN domain-containing protein [Nanoarchaeota archaeon]